MIVQYVLISSMLAVLLYFLGHHTSARVRAWKRIILVGFIALGVAAVLYPEATNQLAQLVGVGRGADLLLYLTVVAFVFVSLNVYLKFRDLEHRIGRLVSSVAVLEARLGEQGHPPSRDTMCANENAAQSR